MKFLGFESSCADKDVWMQESVQKDGVTKYYEYVLLYTDDCLVISDRGEIFFDKLDGEIFQSQGVFNWCSNTVPWRQALHGRTRKYPALLAIF